MPVRDLVDEALRRGLEQMFAIPTMPRDVFRTRSVYLDRPRLAKILYSPVLTLAKGDNER
jgi:hypothetical protein